MVPATQPASSQPIPQNLKTLLPNPQTPWNVSLTLFNRVQALPSDQPFRLCEVLRTDHDYNFILKYFEHQKPVGYSIKRVVCIHNPDHTQVFEGTLKNQEREANNPVFAPNGKDEEPKADRTRVLIRWESHASQFSPIEVKSSNSRESDICSKAKVLPLWHGSSASVCRSVCSSGFTSFGKHHYFDEAAQKGDSQSTDKGYFGSGIYFTNSAKYATMYSSEGHLLLSWVSMREPYPVVNDKPHPQKGSDMIKLGGKEHYQDYNAHFIPVASIRPNDSKCLEYYPCFKDQSPAWDEFVVFHTSQALPRFWIELGLDLPTVVLSELGTAGEFLTLLLSLLDKKEVLNHAILSGTIRSKIEKLLHVNETQLLEAEDQKFLKLAKRLLIEGEKLSNSTLDILLKINTPSPVANHPSSFDISSLQLTPSTPYHSYNPNNYAYPTYPYVYPPSTPSQQAYSYAPSYHPASYTPPTQTYSYPPHAPYPAPHYPPSYPVVPEQNYLYLPHSHYIPSASNTSYSSPAPGINSDTIYKSILPEIAFGKEKWAKYIGDVGDEPPLPADIYTILQSTCPFFPGKRVEETHLLTLIPKTVNGKPLTLDSLNELVQQPKQGQATKYSYYLNEIQKQYGTQSLPRSYWVLMTRDVIPGSRSKSYDAQVQLLREQSQKAGVAYEVPHLLEAATSILMEYLRTGKRLYSDSPWTYTRCQERVSEYPAWPLIVVGFAAGGLVVDHDVGSDSYGLGGLRKF